MIKQMAKLAAIWIGLLLPINAFACFCVDSTSFEDHFNGGKAHVFKGVVEKNILDTNIVWGSRPFVATTFRVEVDYTSLDRPISCNKYTVRQSWSNCDKIFFIDSTYVVFASENFLEFMGTSSCTPTRLFSKLSAEEIAVLGNGNREFGECAWREIPSFADPEGQEPLAEEPEETGESRLIWMLIGIIGLLLLMLINMKLKSRKRKD